VYSRTAHFPAKEQRDRIRRRPALRIDCSPVVARGQEYAPRVSLLGIAVESLQSGVVIRLSGETDLSTVGQLRDALDGQISGGVRQLTIDLSGLRFADSGSIRALTDAHLALKAQGGTLELIDPQPNVARILVLLGIDQVLTVRPQPDSGTAGARLQEG
jgi:anti-sigma B factor antagonist